MLTFGPLTAFNERTSQPLPGTPIQVFTLDGAAVDTFTLDGAPLVLVSNARGYVGMFQADTSERVLVARARGGNDQPVYAHETLDEAAGLAEIVNDGRLSEASLMSTFAHMDGDRLSIDGAPVTAAQAVGDTGWRTMSPLDGAYIDPSHPGQWQLRRIGPLVLVKFISVGISGTGTSGFITGDVTIPAGFRAPNGQYHTVTAEHSSGVPSTIGDSHRLLTSGAQIRWRGMITNDGSVRGTYGDYRDRINGSTQWATDEPMPTQPYPGTPA